MGFRPHAIALLKQTSIFKWCMARLVVENLHQKDRCQDGIEIFVLNWITSTIEKAHCMWTLLIFVFGVGFWSTSLWPSITFYASTTMLPKLLKNKQRARDSLLLTWWNNSRFNPTAKIGCGDGGSGDDVPLCTYCPSSLCCITQQQWNTPEITD